MGKTNTISDIQYLSKFISENKEDPKIIGKLKVYAEQLLNKKGDDFLVPDWHKDIVRERIKNTKEEDYISLKELDKLIII